MKIKKSAGVAGQFSLTAETELLLDPNTYGNRMLTSTTLPGALVREMAFTL